MRPAATLDRHQDTQTEVSKVKLDNGSDGQANTPVISRKSGIPDAQRPGFISMTTA